MKMRNKGKVHPSPAAPSPSPSSSSSSSSSSHYSHNNKDALSVLKLLPAAILAIASVLSLEDREVLAYMITRSLKSTNPSSFLEEKTKKNGNPTKKSSSSSSTACTAHSHNNTNNKTPLFDCECFDCYTSFWFRWDSSPNRELIHQVIEAFEEHLNLGEQPKKGKNRKKDKVGRRGLEKRLDFPDPEVGSASPEIVETISSLDGRRCSQENEVTPPFPPEEEAASLSLSSAYNGDSGEAVDVVESPEMAAVVRGRDAATATAAADNHKGLARKVLPDVLGLLNSRLWNLWSPNV